MENGVFTKPMVCEDDVYFDSCESLIFTDDNDSTINNNNINNNSIDRVFPLSAKTFNLLKTIVHEFDDCHCRSPLCDVRVSEIIKHFENIAGNDVNEAETTRVDRGSLACTVKRLIGFYQSKLLKTGVGTSCPSFVHKNRTSAAAATSAKSPRCRTPRRRTPRRLAQSSQRSNSPRLSTAASASLSSSSPIYAKKESPRRSRLDLDRSTISVCRRSLNYLPTPEKAAIRPVSEIRKCFSPGLKKQQQQQQKQRKLCDVHQSTQVPSIVVNDSSTGKEEIV
ncbi:uncharacterized protein LOC106649563 [Trichogramma pretiosum]|uniref:uncharacterized protein LOC106649563 n=1 Tax=Trichogramma pretiosum TaxID=7493 RepID=UPI0006C9E42D|nr:uncharacterized protein LOC106649563 [Trichogramma pretiosum]